MNIRAKLVERGQKNEFLHISRVMFMEGECIYSAPVGNRKL